VRLLWSLPKAAPVLLRHFAAYAELAGRDLAQAQRDIAASLLAFVIVAVSLFFALLMGCVAVVAVTWDTPHRLTAILCTGGIFVVIAVIAMIYRSNMIRGHAPFLASVRQAWQEDRVALERILSDEN
jgi:uncharacterized membrane protein YqjE